jgi:hypothetical protein
MARERPSGKERGYNSAESICKLQVKMLHITSMKLPFKPDEQYGPTACGRAVERPYCEATWQVGRLDKNPCRDLNPNSDTVG